ncbi:MAG: endonuclease MutS2 [Thermaerobacter sp.]|nr:endonuclease MutS2 [Thermaerobacter sp.]
MHERSWRVLELDKVREVLAGFVSSELGRELVVSMSTSGDRAEVVRWLRETGEARAILRNEEFPLKGIADVRAVVKRCQLGASVPPHDLFALAEVLATARRAQKFFMAREATYPLLAEHAAGIVSHRAVEDEILSCIGEGGEVLDKASDKLRTVRHDIRSAQSEIRAKLEGMLRSSSIQKYLQEQLVTMRGDRYVLPVKTEYKGQVPGLVHDQSASGATVFIEPMAVVVINNKLRQYMALEEHEIERIVRQLSGSVGEHATSMLSNLKLLARLDFSLAKGRLSLEWQCTEPDIAEGRELFFKGARHPLIPRHEVRPIDVRLGQEFNVLLITGPNTGGKTVTLKTVGLLTLMVQCGLHIPVASASRAAIFDTVFADIGDEQSIEQSLSTFSSHMTNICHIVDVADGHSLVLLDELGAGTDPTEGAALAMAIVDTLLERGTRIVATTHYSELKAYAHTKSGVQNASMEFDVDSLRPTFKLTIGLPGKSNAFEISERLGLDTSVIGRARGYLSGEVLRVEDLIRSLEKSRLEAEEAHREALSLRSQAQVLTKQVDEKAKRLQDKEKEVLHRAATEARALVYRAKHEIDALIEELRLAQEANSGQEVMSTVEKVRQRWRDLSKEMSPEDVVSSEASVAAPLSELAVGDEVMVTHLKQKGRVLSISPLGQVTVQMGALRTTTEQKNLRKLETKIQPSSARGGGFHMVDLSRGGVRMELDLRGHSVEEGVLKLDKYLDDALLGGLSQVHIIHGKGTGVLREGVRDFLKGHAQVDSFRYGQANEGGSGVTVVVLKR